MISIQRYIYKCKTHNTNPQANPLFSYERFINYFTSVLQQEEGDTILKSLTYHTMLISPPTFSTFRGVLDLNSSSLVGHLQNLTAAATVENSTLWQRTPFSAPMAGAQLFACMLQSQFLNTVVGPQLLNIMIGPQLNLFSNSQPISSGHDVIHTPSPFSVWGLIRTIVIVISFARKCKLHQLTTHLNS